MLKTRDEMADRVGRALIQSIDEAAGFDPFTLWAEGASSC